MRPFSRSIETPLASNSPCTVFALIAGAGSNSFFAKTPACHAAVNMRIKIQDLIACMNRENRDRQDIFVQPFKNIRS